MTLTSKERKLCISGCFKFLFLGCWFCFWVFWGGFGGGGCYCKYAWLQRKIVITQIFSPGELKGSLITC